MIRRTLLTAALCGSCGGEPAQPVVRVNAAPSTSAASVSAAVASPVVSSPPPPLRSPLEDPASSSACPEGMVLVDGGFVPSLGHACTRWISEEKDRCQSYAPRPLTGGKPVRLRFCVDRFEYPNLEGVRPAVMMDWLEAREACELEGKRLCNASEWTLACEGREGSPYPYGSERDPSACNIDRPRPAPEPDFEAFSRPRDISAEVHRLDLRVASGARPRCVSSFGVYDMTGNVDEWTINDAHFAPLGRDKEEKDRPYVSGLKGGYWGPIRARCRPITSSHNPWFRFYQVGFRCCADPTDGSFKGTHLGPLPRRRAK